MPRTVLSGMVKTADLQLFPFSSYSKNTHGHLFIGQTVVTKLLYQRLRLPCKFHYDIPVFSYIPILGVTTPLFLKKKLFMWRVETFSIAQQICPFPFANFSVRILQNMLILLYIQNVSLPILWIIHECDTNFEMFIRQDIKTF